ncbi:MAG TPA: hypothetical protein VFS05_15345 [Gemmatimonadaceae bacterium]|nr:hypothetical protein [Gemmatimonadaceae bacterium]
MMIVRRGRGGFALVTGRGEVGWMARGALGFRGFASAREAASAALVAHGAVVERLRRAGRAMVQPPPLRTLTTTREGGRDWIRVGGRPVGLLLPPWGALRSGPRSYGFELLLPPELGETAMVLLAREVHALLTEPSGSSVIRPTHRCRERLESIEPPSPDSSRDGAEEAECALTATHALAGRQSRSWTSGHTAARLTT